MGKKLLSMMLALVIALGMAVCGRAEDAIVTVRRDLDEMYTIWGLEWDMPLEEALQKIDENGGWDREYDQLYKVILFNPWTSFYYNLDSDDDAKEIIVDVMWNENVQERWICITIQDTRIENTRNMQTFIDAVNAMQKEGFQITAGGCRGYEDRKRKIWPWTRENGKPDLISMHERLLKGELEDYWVVMKNITIYCNVIRSTPRIDIEIYVRGRGITEYNEKLKWTQEDAQIFTEI